jgi:hypothetical protein
LIDEAALAVDRWRSVRCAARRRSDDPRRGVAAPKGRDEPQPESQRLFGALAGSAGRYAQLLENPREDVAAKVDVSGRLANPNVSIAETLVSLIRNAFFEAILPGFERQLAQK